MKIALILGAVILMVYSSKKFYDIAISGVNDEFDHLFKVSAQKHLINPRYIKALSMNESYLGAYGNAVTVNGNTTRGLMHLELPTARDYVSSIEQKDLDESPQLEIDIAAQHFKWLMDQFNGSLELAVRGYNGGIGRVRQYQNGTAPDHWGKNTDEYWTRFQRNLDKIS